MAMFQSRFEQVPDVRKIAVLRSNALGDFILILPALEALRTTYPDAEIVLLAKQWHAAFLADRPGPVDRVIVVPPYRGVNDEPDVAENAAELEHFFEAMKRERFDLAIQLYGGGRYSNPFLLRLGARMTVGLKTPDAVPLNRWIPYVFFQHEVLRYLEVVLLVGATPTTLEPRITLLEKDMLEAQKVVPETSAPLVVLHPGAGDPRRRWSTEKFAAVGDTLADAGAKVIVTGTEQERQLVEAVVNSMRAEAQNVCGLLSLGGLAALLSRCRVMVSNDSGPRHLAAAVGTATVGIYWCFNLVNASPLTRLHHRLFTSWQMTCPICGNDYSHTSCEHHASLVDTISTEEVITAALDLYGAHAT